MRILPAILLRVLLSLTLVLNGAGYAAASTTMELHGSHAKSGDARTATVNHDGTSAPCHTGADVTNAGMAHHGHDSSPAPDTPAANGSGEPDCCDAGQCVCACVQHLVVTLTMPVVADAAFLHATSVRRLSLAHAQPALPHPIRPPIA